MSFGNSKHRKSGTSTPSSHFTGKKGKKADRHHHESHKQRKHKRGTHKNKYA